jgi:hypothetical protein
LRAYYQSAALALTVGALYFLLRSHDSASAEVVAFVARSKWEMSPGVLRGLAMQRADAWVACSLLGGAVLLQMGGAAVSGRWNLLAQRPGAVLAAVLCSGLVVAGAAAVSHRLADDAEARVRSILALPPASQLSWNGESRPPLRLRPPRAFLHEG